MARKIVSVPTTLQRYYVDYSSQRSNIPTVSARYSLGIDPLRENPRDRDRLYQLYRDDLTARKLSYAVIEGQAGRRLDCALEFLQQQGI